MEVIHDGGVEALTRHLEGAARDDAAQADDGGLGKAAADVQDHTAAGRAYAQSRARRLSDATRWISSVPLRSTP